MRIKPINSFIRKTFGILFGEFEGITLCPFGIYIEKESIEDDVILNHEKIHWRQQLEMLVLPFYIWYLLEMWIKAFYDKKTAYTCLSFEREAYKHQYEKDYLIKRKPYAWVKYLWIKDCRDGRIT